jgi:hypothetical protein
MPPTADPKPLTAAAMIGNAIFANVLKWFVGNVRVG